MDRLDKFLAENTDLSRSDAKNAIKKGRVEVDGAKAKSPEMKVDEGNVVTLDGNIVSATGMIYIMLHKPQGVLSATEDGRTRTVIDMVHDHEKIMEKVKKTDLFPIGRLDKDTEGLIFLTNNGMLSHQLLSPKHHVEKKYYAECDGTLSDNASELFEEGLMVGEDYRALPARLEVIEKGPDSCKLYITLTEGKFHQVKRMCHEVGVEVTYLKRVEFGGITLDPSLPVGEMRFLTEDEIRRLTFR